MTRPHLVLALAAALLVGGQPPAAAADPATVITVGTSIEGGTGLQPGESWPSRLDVRTPATVVDRSLPGGAYTASSADGDNIRKHVDAAIAEDPDLLILGPPVNDLVILADVTPLREAVYAAVRAAEAAGVPVLVMGILPFNDGGAFPAGWWPTLEERRQAFNTWAAAMYGGRFIDLGWVLHETTTWRADNRFFRDGLHPTRVGAALIGEVFPLERLEAS